MIVHLGARGDPKRADDRGIEGGGSAIVFLMLDFGHNEAPDAIAQSIHVVDDKNAPHDMALAPLTVSREKPIVVAAPLRGEWIAGDSLHNGTDAAHRRAVLVEDAHAWLSQRYAIDWVQIPDGRRRRARPGAGRKTRTRAISATTSRSTASPTGRWCRCATDCPKTFRIPGKYVTPIDFDTAGGNHAVVEIAPQRYVLYAHMRPGSLRVKVGDVVQSRRGARPCRQHRQFDRAASAHAYRRSPVFSGGNGVPYEFASGEASGPIEANVSSPTPSASARSDRSSRLTTIIPPRTPW